MLELWQFKLFAVSSNFTMGQMCVENLYDIFNKVKHTQDGYAVRQLSTTARVYPDARISTNLIQGYNKSYVVRDSLST